MAIARGAGTEIIRSIWAEDVDSSASTVLVFGVQHHIYTILNITAHAISVATDRNWILCFMKNWDSKGGTSAQEHSIFKQDMSAQETFVWNDKFSFNGYEPTGISGEMNTAAEQDAIADQGGSVANILYIQAEAATDNFEVSCTYIDQNNS